MQKEFLSIEHSVALKELGFDEPCLAYYNNEQLFPFTQRTKEPVQKHYIKMSNRLRSPLYQQAFRWFREMYELHSWVTMELGMRLTYCWVITGEHKGSEHKSYFNTHEEAEFACLEKLIQIVKSNEKC